MDSFIALLNTTGKSFVEFAGSMLIQSSMLIVVLLILDLALRKRVRAVFRYCIWMLILVKLVLPTTLSSPTSLGYWFSDRLPAIAAEEVSISEQTSPILPSVEPVTETVSPEATIAALPSAYTAPESIANTFAESEIAVSPAVSTASLSWQGLVFLAWLAAVITMTLLLIQRTFFVRGLIAQSKDATGEIVDIFEQCCKQMRVRRRTALRFSPVAASPSVCGLFRPTILIPEGLPGKLNPQHLKSILLHELAHIERGDLWVSLIQTILQIVYVYNPLLWVANAIIRKVREQAVDEMVLVAMGEQAEDYPETLLNISRLAFSRPALSLRLIGVVESKKALTSRIKYIVSRPFPKTAKLGVVGLVGVIIMAAILLPMARAKKQSTTNTSTILDSDKDGLSDFQEVHKYLTDPAKKDSDGDGISDGDWNERREYTYSVRSVLRFMPPVDKAALNDDFQDGRVLQEKDDYIEIEVIHYPLSTAEKAIAANPNWQSDYAKMTEYTKLGITTNWDAKMRQDLLAELKADGIAIDKLTDKQVVEQVSSWLLRKSKSLDKVFTTYYIHCPDGKPSVYPGLEGAFESEFNRDKANYDWTIDQHLDHEVMGKGMFYNKTHGSCTSTAIYLTTVLRALGIPTRMIIASPIVDASNVEQFSLVKNGVSHNQIREDLLTALRQSSHGFTNHTFNEVYVGNQWQRLDHKRLGPNRKRPFGLPTHLYTFNDLSEANLAATWGLRYGKGQKADVFGYDNPYSAIAVSDLFGKHSNIPNPPATKQRKSYSSLPNIYIMHPSGLVGWWEDFVEMVKDTTSNKTGRNHEKKFYDEIFIDGIWNRKAGDIIVLLFALDSSDRIPPGYEDILPKPWQQIEADLKQAKTVELQGKAHDLKIILLAAPTKDQLKQLIHDSRLIKAIAAAPGTESIAGQPANPVDFEITNQKFLQGDSIVITEILGSTDKIETGQTYTIKGKYKLSSHDQAKLHIYATNGQTHSKQGPVIKRSTGNFTRTLTYQEDGWLHLSFYPAEGGSSFGDLYFAQKGSGQKTPDLATITSVVGTPKPSKQKTRTARFLRIEVNEDSEDAQNGEEIQNAVSLAIPLAGLKAGNKVLPKTAEDQMDKYGITIDEIIKMLEDGVEPMILLDIEEKAQSKSEEINFHVRISLE